MQVSRAGDGIRLTVEEPGEVGEVVAVSANLCDGVESGRVGVALDEDQFAVVLLCRGAAPLLQLDDHVRRAAGLRVPSSEYHVGAFGSQWEVVFDQDLDVAQPCLDQVLREDRQAAFPGSEFCRGSTSTGVVAHLLGDPRGQGSICRQVGDTDGRMAKERHGWSPPGSTNRVVRVGGMSCER